MNAADVSLRDAITSSANRYSAEGSEGAAGSSSSAGLMIMFGPSSSGAAGAIGGGVTVDELVCNQSCMHLTT